MQDNSSRAAETTETHARAQISAQEAQKVTAVVVRCLSSYCDRAQSTGAHCRGNLLRCIQALQHNEQAPTTQGSPAKCCSTDMETPKSSRRIPAYPAATLSCDCNHGECEKPTRIAHPHAEQCTCSTLAHTRTCILHALTYISQQYIQHCTQNTPVILLLICCSNQNQKQLSTESTYLHCTPAQSALQLLQPAATTQP
jgi:hypothetical protein